MNNDNRSTRSQGQNAMRQEGTSGSQAQGERNQSSGRGFASMDPERQREIASQGGRASSGNFANNPDRAAEAGRKGGQNRGRAA